MSKFKPGDLAIIIKSRYGNEGKIVQLVEFVGPLFFADSGVYERVWEFTPEIPSKPGPHNGKTKLAAEEWLKKIEGSEGIDEMLQIAGKPKETTPVT